MWKCVFGEMDMCICLCQNTGAMNRSPTLGGVFRGYFVGECWVFTECFVVISWVFVALLTIRSHRIGRLLAAVGDRFIVPVYTCSPRVRYLCVTYSPCKSMVFALQKYGFWRVKTPFLEGKNPLFEKPFYAFWYLADT